MGEDGDKADKKSVGDTKVQKHEVSVTTFDDIENEFNAVINGLGIDAKLAPFRVQYEKLFEALKKSIHQEKYLAKKCIDLTSEVSQNASKVRDALNLSRQDQNAIMMLKQDTERAWSLVEEGKEKETTISVAVDRLQDETNILSSQLQEARTRVLELEEETIEIKKHRDGLKSERDGFWQKIIQAGEREKDLKMQIHVLENGSKELHDVNLSLSKQINERVEQVEALKKSKKCSMEEASNLKSRLKQKTEDYINLQYSESLAKDRSEQLDQKLKDTNKKMETQATDCDALKKETERLREMLEMQRIKMGSINEAFKKNEEGLKLATAIQSRIASEKVHLQRKYESEHKNALRLQQELADTKAACNISKKEIHALQQLLDDSNQHVDQATRKLTSLKREKDLLYDKLHRYEKSIKDSEDHIGNQNQSIVALEKELSKAGDTIGTLNKKLNSVGKLSEKHNHDLSQERIASEKIKDVIRLKDIEVQEIKKELDRWKLKSSEETQICNQLRVDRGKISKLLNAANEESKSLRDEINVLANETKCFRQELSSKDDILVKERFETKQEKTKKEQALSDLSRMKKHLDVQEASIQKQDLIIRRLNSSLKHMDDDAFNQRKEYDEIVNERDVLGAQLIRRNDELTLLQEQLKMQEILLKKGENQYQDRLDEIRLLQHEGKDLRRELNNNKNTGPSDDDRLWRKLAQTEKALLQEKVKVKALSEELENPLNVHRWRKLQGTDPTTFELMQKIELLQRRLIKKSEHVSLKIAILTVPLTSLLLFLFNVLKCFLGH